MKIIFLFLTTFFAWTIVYGQSQTEMNIDAGNKFKSVDDELNEVYKEILNEYSGDTLFIKKLKVAQRLWLQLREADIEARYLPGEFYGSVKSMCTSALYEEWTRERIKFLRIWIEGINHQDACKGTVKEKAR